MRVLVELGFLIGDDVVFRAEDGIREAQEARGLGDLYKRQVAEGLPAAGGLEACCQPRLGWTR